MMAMSKRIEPPPPDELEALLPWYAAGTLNARDARRIEDALARDSALAQQYAAILQEQAETIRLNEDLGAPSPRAMHRLFAAIDAEPQRRRGAVRSRAWISELLASLSPRTLAWSASLGALILVAQAAVIGVVLLREDATRPVQTASYEAPNGPITRSMQNARVPAGSGPLAMVRFAADARAADIAALLDAYQASIIGSSRGGLYRLQFGGRGGAAPDAAATIAQLQNERIVSFAGPAQ